MGRRRIEERNIRKITKTAGGKSYAITIPIEHMRNLKWQHGQKVVVEQDGDSLTVKPAR